MTATTIDHNPYRPFPRPGYLPLHIEDAFLQWYTHTSRTIDPYSWSTLHTAGYLRFRGPDVGWDLTDEGYQQLARIVAMDVLKRK